MRGGRQEDCGQRLRRKTGRPRNGGRSVRRQRIGFCGALALAALLAADAAGIAPSSWDWPLPPRRFGALSAEERLQYTKAEDLIRKNQYDAAAVEFEKFMVQNAKSAIAPRCLLMRAFCLHLAAKRNQAIALYNELLDLYGEAAVDDAVPAAYLMGSAQIENGNTEQGIQVLKTLVENEKYLQNPLADTALNQLASYAAGRGDEKAAEKYWRLVVGLYRDAFMRPDAGYQEALRNLTEVYIRQQRFGALDELFAQDEADSAKAVERIIYVFDRGMAGFDQLSKNSRLALARWIGEKKGKFAEAQRTSDYLNRAADIALRINARKEWSELIREALAEARGQPDDKTARLYANLTEHLGCATRAGWPVDAEWKALSEAIVAGYGAQPAAQQIAAYGGLLDRLRFKSESGSAARDFEDIVVARYVEQCKTLVSEDRDQGLATLVDKLKLAERPERALNVAAQIEDQPRAQWKAIEVLDYQKKYAEAAKACEELEKIDSGDYAARAVRARARFYKDYLARYAEAIRLYSEINDPPATTWAMIECYERLSKPAEAVNLCAELENFFEKDAPVAAFRKAQIWERAGDKAKAIAAARAVLKKYPKHQASSQAHQMLERHGIATGGGVTDVE
jgi:tetratricopeptide (TPR) repeat protein